MKHRVVSFILLVFFRVFLVPAWFSWHIDNVKDPGETYEQVRLKKRRSSCLEENIYIYELVHSRMAVLGSEQRLLSFRPETASILLSTANGQSLSSFVSSNIVLPLYLRNRMLRI